MQPTPFSLYMREMGLEDLIPQKIKKQKGFKHFVYFRCSMRVFKQTPLELHYATFEKSITEISCINFFAISTIFSNRSATSSE